MKFFKTFGFILLLVVGGFACYNLLIKKETIEEEVSPYDFVELERKNLSNLVSSTGELAAREIVEIGTQVSGTINDVHVDFNDKVEAGKLLAVIDPSVLDAQVKGAKAGYMRAQAQQRKAKLDVERYQPVYEQGYLAEKDFIAYEIALESANASLMDSEASLDRAYQNRKYAEIFSPISGLVIDRQVEKGQTVAASFNTPTLFTIAEDLEKMEIIANVDETDIGLIEEGQEVRFTVPAYPDDKFVGVVTQLRLQPNVIQNVVNYEVVVETENPDIKLLPGMTATMDFVVEEVEDALVVPVSALNVRANEDMMAAMKKMREERIAQFKTQGKNGEKARNGESKRMTSFPGMGGPGGPGGPPRGGNMQQRNGGHRGDMVVLWFQNEDGELRMMRVSQGVSDGAYVEVKPGRMGGELLVEGLKVIKKVNNASSSSSSKSQDMRGGGLRRLGF